MKVEKLEIRICGSGGQGAVLAGEILGRAIAKLGLNVTQTQSYGAEPRGSKTKSEVIVAREKIGYPMVRECDILVAMNQDSFDFYNKDLKKDGLAIVDEDLVRVNETDYKVIKIPATDLAKKNFGSSIFTNMIMLGALSSILKDKIGLSLEEIKKAIEEKFSEKYIENNLKAIKIGFDYIC